MDTLSALEKKLTELFVDQGPELPGNSKRAIVQYLPWLSLLLGLLTLYNAYVVWHWARVANRLITYINNPAIPYGGVRAVGNHLTVGVWLGIVVLLAEALLYAGAFSATQQRKKTGWDFIFYALLLNVAYSAIIMFTAYGDLGNFIGSVVGSGVGLYLLFQIRETYDASKPRTTTKKRRTKPQPARKKT